jgi:hypothetical protein
MAEMIVSGIKELDASIAHLEARFSEAARNVVVKGGALVAQAAQREFTSVKGVGVKYRGGHVSGDRPHIRTGNLARSIATRDVQMVSPGRWMSTTGPTMAYGRRIELGFRGEVKAQSVKQHQRRTPSGDMTTVKAHERRGHQVEQNAYPYMSPGFNKAKPELIALYESEFKKALNG